MESVNTIAMLHQGIVEMRQQVGAQAEAQTFDLFLRIAQFPGQSQLAMSEQVGISLAATSRIVERLRKAGLITRKEDPQDRRNKVLSLTTKGHRVINRVRDACEQRATRDLA